MVLQYIHKKEVVMDNYGAKSKETNIFTQILNKHEFKV